VLVLSSPFDRLRVRTTPAGAWLEGWGRSGPSPPGEQRCVPQAEPVEARTPFKLPLPGSSETSLRLSLSNPAGRSRCLHGALVVLALRRAQGEDDPGRGEAGKVEEVCIDFPGSSDTPLRLSLSKPAARRRCRDGASVVLALRQAQGEDNPGRGVAGGCGWAHCYRGSSDTPLRLSLSKPAERSRCRGRALVVLALRQAQGEDNPGGGAAEGIGLGPARSPGNASGGAVVRRHRP